VDSGPHFGRNIIFIRETQSEYDEVIRFRRQGLNKPLKVHLFFCMHVGPIDPRTSPSSGQASINFLLRRLIISACRSRAAYVYDL